MPVALWLNCTSKARNRLSTGPARTHHWVGDQVPVPRNDPGTSQLSPEKAALLGGSCPCTGGCSERESGLESAGYPQSLPRRKEQKLLEETGEHLSAVGAPGPASPSRQAPARQICRSPHFTDRELRLGVRGAPSGAPVRQPESDRAVVCLLSTQVAHRERRGRGPIPTTGSALSSESRSCGGRGGNRWARAELFSSLETRAFP